MDIMLCRGPTKKKKSLKGEDFCWKGKGLCFQVIASNYSLDFCKASNTKIH